MVITYGNSQVYKPSYTTHRVPLCNILPPARL